MSGGVDSSVAAALLLESGWDVSGVTMMFRINFPGGDSVSVGEKAAADAANVCASLGIKHYTADFTGAFNDFVIGDFVSNYFSGRTPNPCVICNWKLKFGLLADFAFSRDYSFFATGHYSSIEQLGGKFYIKRDAHDPKDQTYFLWRIDPRVLPGVVFPLSGMRKDKVRAKAKEMSLHVADKGDSQDICFLPDDDYRGFLSRIIGSSGMLPGEGDFIGPGGCVLGKHMGIHNYTIGQRRGLGIGYHHPLYVSGFNIPENAVYLSGKDALYSKSFTVSDCNLFGEIDDGEYDVKTRYAQKDGKCRLKVNGNVIVADLAEAADAVTPGQSAVFYRNDLLIGGGIINSVLT